MSKALLQLNSSIYSGDGQSTRLADALVARWREANPRGAVIVRDLARNPVPHMTGERFQAFITSPEQRTPEQRVMAAESDALVEELKRADVIVIAAPMYNFGIPSTLKTWFDHVARAGVTFRYTAQGPVGLLTGKKVYGITTRGGFYAGTPADTETAYLRQFLGFLGMADLEFVYAEGLAISEASKTAGIAQAHEAIERLNEEALEPLAA
jgi:FMN-dependent NADH-azoreductase